MLGKALKKEQFLQMLSWSVANWELQEIFPERVLSNCYTDAYAGVASF